MGGKQLTLNQDRCDLAVSNPAWLMSTKQQCGGYLLIQTHCKFCLIVVKISPGNLPENHICWSLFSTNIPYAIDAYYIPTSFVNHLTQRRTWRYGLISFWHKWSGDSGVNTAVPQTLKIWVSACWWNALSSAVYWCIQFLVRYKYRCLSNTLLLFLANSGFSAGGVCTPDEGGGTEIQDMTFILSLSRI